MSSKPRVHVLELSLDGKPFTKPNEVLLLPIPRDPYVLRIVLPGTSPLLNSAPVFKCNFPPRDKEFDRRKFVEYKLEAPLTGNCVVDIDIWHSGAFEARVGDVAWNFVVQTGFSLKGTLLTANALCVQTVLSKLVDPKGSVRSDRWRETLETIAGKQYNMIHFVPLQPRGESGSPFSILDQLEWDKHTFPKGEADVEYLVSELERVGILGLSDIVLNHTAADSPWLADHLDAGYSVETAPHLECALALDTELLKFRGEINTGDDARRVAEDAVRQAARTIRLWEFYVIDSDVVAHTVEQHPFQGTPASDLPTDLKELARSLAERAGKNLDVLGPRFARSLDTSVLAEYVAGSAFSAKQLIDEVNVALYAEYNDDLSAAVSSVQDRQRYLRLDANGPQIGHEITEEAPIIESYFNRRFAEPLACNGWVWAGNPLIDHAGPESKAFIRRELIVWQDCTKLRYGKKPEDSPYLWDRMAKYARLLAKHFAGLRMDNSHSTPLHVGEFILDEARRVRPNLYVVAELFSGSQEMDKLYVERLGISSLLREAIMAGNPQDLSSVVHANGGLAIGSLINPTVGGSETHAWLMEVTHDNETLAEKRTVEDTLPTAGLVAMCQVASGCTFGNDECYPHALSVVTESRAYTLGGGITEAKSVLNSVHQYMARTGMVESYTDYRGQYITVHRISPESGEGIFLVARTKFWDGDEDQALEPIKLESSRVDWLHGWSFRRLEPNPTESEAEIKSIPTELQELDPINTEFNKGVSTIHIDSSQFPQGSVAIWKTSRTFDAYKIESLMKENADSATAAVKDLDLLDLNLLLYRTEGEERAITNGERGVYAVPDLHPLVYAGIQGWETILEPVVHDQDLGHPLCANLRAGLWAFEYTTNRIPNEGRFKATREWLEARLEATRKVPSFLRPRYFAATIMSLYRAATSHALKLMHYDPATTSTFYKHLTLVSVQMVNTLPNCSLYPDRTVPTMAAGLPHFSEGVMRCWGRDVFLSVGGLLLRLGRLAEAKEHILGFGSTLKYGLIPNLLDSGANPRYNARDAAWFFVECIQDYCKTTKSLDLLNETVQRRFPLDDSYTEKRPEGVTSTVGELVFEVLARHAKGIEFREHNAGSDIDMHMKSNGFNQRIWTDWKTGIVFGGNQDNCGTWQDKMGESPMAGSEGVPGTPRDGAAIEITALLKSCLRWVNEVRSSGKYDWPKEVETQDGDKVTTEHWEKLLQQNFERCYFVPESEDDKDHEGKSYDVDWTIVNRRGIYKDVYKSGKPYEDYQLRSNFTVAVTAAPELFDVEKISKTLSLADRVLRGPVGMATLDPSDWNYRPYYINSVESADFATSRGRNYHQGPEWVWQFGTFLHAFIQTLKRQGAEQAAINEAVRNRLRGNIEWIRDSDWSGLTELTQKNGEFCPDSSPTQAWSAARIIEAICAAAS